MINRLLNEAIKEVEAEAEAKKFSLRPRTNHMRPRPRPRSRPQCLRYHATYKYISIISHIIYRHQSDRKNNILLIVILIRRFSKKVKVKERIVLREIHLRTTGRHLSNGITQCYLLPGRLVLDLSTP